MSFCALKRPFQWWVSPIGALPIGSLSEALMHWTKWSWLALGGCLIVAAVAWILFAPELNALGKSLHGH
jgi:hypothetical protein